MAITKIRLGKCLMCDGPMPDGKIFVCRGKCEDMSGITEMRMSEYLPFDQRRQLIARKIVAKRKYLENRDYHIMMDTREFIKGLREI